MHFLEARAVMPLFVEDTDQIDGDVATSQCVTERTLVMNVDLEQFDARIDPQRATCLAAPRQYDDVIAR